VWQAALQAQCLADIIISFLVLPSSVPLHVCRIGLPLISIMRHSLSCSIFSYILLSSVLRCCVHVQSSRLACFSSIGPTSDGRIKPDVVAPGDFVQSAWSGDPSITLQALLGGEVWAKDGGPSCAVHQMSGTSMATPVTGERRGDERSRYDSA
jgi:Subtilase family